MKSGPKFLHSDVKYSLPIIADAWLQLLLQRGAQPVIRFRGKLLFHIGPGRFGQLFPLINEIIISKLHLYLLRLSLCNIKISWWSETLSVTNMQKKKYIYICNKVQGSGKEGRGSQGWRAKKRGLITQNKRITKRKHGSLLRGFSLFFGASLATASAL